MPYKLKLDTGKATRAIRSAAFDGLESSVEDIAEEANDRAPVETGFLRASQHVDTDRGSLSSTIVYDADYAVAVHEVPPNSGGVHGTGYDHDPPTSHKFLEGAAYESIPEHVATVGAHIKKRLT